MKKQKIKKQDILETSNQPAKQIAEVVWIEKRKAKKK
jgi:hypothetical protein